MSTKNNVFKKLNLPNIVVPPEQWPGNYVYYYCSECEEVVGIPKIEKGICPICGKEGLKDIFSEITCRLDKSWIFIESTRYKKDSWLFKMDPQDVKYSLWATCMAMGAYAELRSMGFESPWGDDDKIIDKWVSEVNRFINNETNLLKVSVDDEEVNPGPHVSSEQYVSGCYSWQMKNRFFSPEIYQAPSGQMLKEDKLEDRKIFLEYIESMKGVTNSYGGGSWVTRAIDNHQEILISQGKNPNDEMIEFAHQWLDETQNPKTGAWLTWLDDTYDPEIIANSMFKIIVSYENQNWEIMNKEEIIDFLIDERADNKKGFGIARGGCSVFDPMMVLMVLRNRGCNYRYDEIDACVAKSFLGFLDRWDGTIHWFKGGTLNEKHNLGIILYMAAILLKQPYQNACTIYNWRKAPIITRKEDGTVVINSDVEYD